MSEKALEPASCHDMPPPSTNIVNESALKQANQESLNRVDLKLLNLPSESIYDESSVQVKSHVASHQHLAVKSQVVETPKSSQ